MKTIIHLGKLIKLLVFISIVAFVAFANNTNAQERKSKRKLYKPQLIENKKSALSEYVKPDKTEIVNIDGQLYYKYYMTPEKLCKKYNSEVLDLSKYKGYYLQMKLPDIQVIANSLDNESTVDSVQVINSTTAKVFLSKNNFINKFGVKALDTDDGEYKGYYIYKKMIAAPYLPISSPYPTDKPEIMEKRSPYARHFMNDDETVTAILTIQPTSYYSDETYEWIDIDLTKPIPPDIITILTKSTKGTVYPGMTYYGNHYEYNNDGNAPYNHIVTGAQTGWYHNVGQDVDWNDEYHRASYQFDVTSIEDGSDVTYVGLKTYITSYDYGEFDDDYGYTDVKQLNIKISNYNYDSNPANWDCFTHDIMKDIGVDNDEGTNNNLAYFSYDYVYVGEGWSSYGYYNLGSTACSDVESHLAANWWCVGLQEWCEEWGYYGDDLGVTYSNNVDLKVTYTPPCYPPTTVTAYANGSSSATVCPGTSFNLTKNSHTGGECSGGSWQYAWYNGTNWWNGSFSSGSPVYSSTYNSISTSVTSNTTFTLRMRCSACTGTYTSDNVSVWVYTESTAPTSITGTTTICSGSSTDLSVSGGSLGSGASWKWYSGGCPGTYVGTGSSVNVDPTSNTTYYVRAEGTCNTTACANTTVTVNTLSSAASSASATPDHTSSGEVSHLSLTGGTLGTGASWIWYSGGCGTGGSIGTGTTIDVYPTSTTIYYVRAEGTCNTTSCVNVTVEVTGSATICNGDDVDLTQIGSSLGSGASWKWYAGDCGVGGSIGSGVTINVMPASDITYYVRAEGTCNTTNCASVAIAVNSLSTAPTSITGTTTICAGGSTNLSESGGSLGTGASYQWYSGGCPGTSVGSGTPVNVSPGTTTNYYVRAEGVCNTTACANTTVTVYPVFTVGNITGGGGTICYNGDPSTMTAHPSGGSGTYSYQWYYKNGTTNPNSGGTIIAGATNSTYNPPSGLTQTRSYQCQVDDSGSPDCGAWTWSSNYITVTVNPTLAQGTIQSNQSICSGETPSQLNFSTAPSGGDGSYTYQWQDDDGGWADISGATSSTYSPPALTSTTKYRCNVTSCGETKTTNEITITVNSLPTASASNNGPLCEGATLTLTGGPGAMSDYSWTGPNSYSSGLQSPTVSTSATTAMDGVYTLIVTDANGCTDEANTYATVGIPGLWTGTVDGDWHDINNWSCAVPDASTDVTIPDACPNYPNEYSGGNPVCASLTINSGAAPNITIITGKTLDCGGNITNNGIITMENGSFIECAGNWTNNGTFTSGTGTVTFDGTSTIITGGTGIDQDFYNVTLDGTSATLSANPVNIDGNFTITSGTWNANGLDMYIAGNWTNNGNFTSGTGTVTFDGTSTIVTGGTADGQDFNNVILNGTSATLSTNDMDIDGDLTITAGTLDAGGKDINIAGGWQNNGGTFDPGGGVLEIFDDFSDGNYTSNPTWTVQSGAWEVSSEYLNGDNAASANDRISTPNTKAYGEWEWKYQFETDAYGDESYIKFYFMYTSTTGYPGGASTDGYYMKIGTGGQFNLCRCDGGTGVAILTPTGLGNQSTTWHTAKVTRSSSGEFHIYYGGTEQGTGTTDNTYTTSQYLGIYTYGHDAAENHRIDDIKTKNYGNTVTFDGSPEQHVKSNNSNFWNIVFNNTNSTGITLQDNMTASNNINFTDGIVNTGIHYLISESTVADNLINYSPVSFVNGNLRRKVIASNEYDFPVGTSEKYELSAINITGTSGGLTYLDAHFTEEIVAAPSSPYITVLGTNIIEFLNYGYWTITPDAGSANYDITITSRGHTNGGTVATQHAVLKRDGGVWASVGTHNNDTQTGTENNPITAKRTELTNFSDFIIGKCDDGSSLPIELIIFTAKCNNNIVELNWTTASEINNDYFTIEKCKDDACIVSDDWKIVTNIDGAGTSNELKYYSYTDENPCDGISYYRLKQTDFDGAFKYSDIEIVDCSGLNNPDVIFYPNPFRDELIVRTINISSINAEIEIYGVLGDKVLEQTLYNIDKNNNKFIISLSKFFKGAYLIKFTSDNFIKTQKIIKNQ